MLALAFGAAMLMIEPPTGLTRASWSVAAIGVVMALLWMTEALPLAVTALIPLVAFPLLQVTPLAETAQAFANPIIFLFLGGFLIARALQRWDLHRRLAFALLTRAGSSPRAILAALMGTCGLLSMWISNTAAAIVMISIAQAIVATRSGSPGADEHETDGFAPALMLGIAFSATIGGMATLIGTPPNAVFAGFAKTAYGLDIGFVQWMMVGLPVTVILLPVCWLLLIVMFVLPRNDAARAPTEIAPPRALSRPQIAVAAIAAATAAALVLRPLIDRLFETAPLSDPLIVLAGALVLFAMPAGDGTRLLSWRDAETIRWDVLILFGGGLALAHAIDQSGLARWIGSGVDAMSALPLFVIVLALMAIVVYLGELASNTAMAAIFLPIAGAVAVGLGGHPLDLVLPIALAASLGFMLPVATPPNAIAIGTGSVTARQMLKVGAVLDIVGLLITFAVAVTLGPIVFAAVF